MFDYWRAHGRPARLTMLRAQAAAPEVEIVAAGRDTVRVGGRAARLTRYTVGRLVFGREVAWTVLSVQRQLLGAARRCAVPSARGDRMEETLYRIDNPALYKTLLEDMGETQSGTYTLIALGDHGMPMCTPRFLGNDPNGILYFGTSEFVASRASYLRQTICSFYRQEGYTSGGHSGGLKLWVDSEKLKRLIPTYDRFRLRVRPCQEYRLSDRSMDWLLYENELLGAYRRRFGEVPPLNG